VNVEDARNLCLRLLARREYSAEELRRQMLRHGLGAEPAERVLQGLQADGYQSDQRFAGMLLRHCFQRQQGPERVRQTLRLAGVSDTISRVALAEFDGDWFELARQLWQRRFGATGQVPDLRERARQFRFLSGRGFTRDQIEYACSEKGDGGI
jgi:regulatory protein